LLEQFGMKASMSRKGNCHDNAPMESFWSSLKNELVHHRRFPTWQQAKDEVSEYIVSSTIANVRKQGWVIWHPQHFYQQYYRNQLVAKYRWHLLFSNDFS
jgi:putative transposase